MAFLAVSAPLNHCRSRSDDIHGRSRQELLCNSFLHGTPLKKAPRQCQLLSQQQHHHHHDFVVLSTNSYPSFPREQASGGSLSASTLSLPPDNMHVGAREVYQPFRPPPSVVPSLENVSIDEHLQVLRERRGMWFDYAIHVPSLIRAGFTPSMIDEATGVSGVEQNKIVVASQVRSSLQAAGMEPEVLSFFDISGGADLLYELRILASDQRKAASLYAMAHKMDIKEYRELARAMKDHDRRKREEGWESFSFCPGDCLAFACYRLSKEVKSEEERVATLQKGLEYVETEEAREKVKAFLEKGEDDLPEENAQNQIEVIRLSCSEAGSPSTPYIIPVIEHTVQGFEAAPAISRKGPFTIQTADSAWESWVSLPPWHPLLTAVRPVALSFPDATFLPWKQHSRKEREEPIIMVADRHMETIGKDAYYVVDSGGGKLAMQLGNSVSAAGIKALGKVILALRPPLPEENDLDSIEWD